MAFGIDDLVGFLGGSGGDFGGGILGDLAGPAAATAPDLASLGTVLPSVAGAAGDVAGGAGGGFGAFLDFLGKNPGVVEGGMGMGNNLLSLVMRFMSGGKAATPQTGPTQAQQLASMRASRAGAQESGLTDLSVPGLASMTGMTPDQYSQLLPLLRGGQG